MGRYGEGVPRGGDCVGVLVYRGDTFDAFGDLARDCEEEMRDFGGLSLVGTLYPDIWLGDDNACIHE